MEPLDADRTGGPGPRETPKLRELAFQAAAVASGYYDQTPFRLTQENGIGYGLGGGSCEEITFNRPPLDLVRQTQSVSLGIEIGSSDRTWAIFFLNYGGTLFGPGFDS